MKKVRIVLDVELPNDFLEHKIDNAIAEAINAEGGTVVDSKPFEVEDKSEEE